jgi:hypothetical protein
LLGSTHGGWKFETNSVYFYDDSNGFYIHMPNSQAELLSVSQLQTNAFFDFSSDSDTADLALLSSGGNAYAQANRDRILSDAIPALTKVAGANPVLILGSTHNFNMSTNTFENGWPEVRTTTTEGINWHHSDFDYVAYPFTHGLFDQIITLGKLNIP